MASRLFSPVTLRGLTLPNRVAVAPMCQYQATDGVPSDWHMVHLGGFKQGGAGLVVVEATGVTAEGRITPGCTGLWNDAQMAAFARINAAVRAMGAGAMAIQLADAGRKASTAAPWDGGGYLTGAAAWECIAPSALPFLDGWPVPREMTVDDIAGTVAAFRAAAERAVAAGFAAVEVHAAHGYLLHQFLSPLTNRRTDGYGGGLEARMRFPLEVFRAVRAAVPDDMPVLLRLSATDWIEGGWDVDQTVEFCKALKEAGCDMIDVSSGGLDQRQEIVAGPGYQVGFAARIRAEAAIPVMAVGQITDPVQAETILASGQADMVALARAMLWDPRWCWRAQVALGDEVFLPAPYARCHPAARGKPFLTRK